MARSIIICKQCGKERLCAAHNLCKFCYYKYYYKPKHEKKCLYCGTKFLTKDNSQKYCSPECGNKAKGEKNRTGKEKRCMICGKSIWVTPSQLKLGKKYCSPECQARGRNYKIKYVRKKKKSLVKYCKNCGKKFQVDWHKGENIFCNRQCYYDYKKKEAQKEIKIKCNYCGKIESFSLSRKVGNKPYAYKWTNGKKILKTYCSKECAELAKMKPREKRICLNCGIEFDVLPMPSRDGCDLLCSKKCQYEYYRNEKAFRWDGGKTNLVDTIRKSTTYINCRNKCFERDGWHSILSGKNGDIEHHHLLSLSILLKKYKITKENWRNFQSVLFNKDNVVTLATKEHNDFHSKYGKVTTPEQFKEFKEQFAN